MEHPAVGWADRLSRPCSADDLRVLDQVWPVPGGVHDSHFRSQVQGRCTYLVAWASIEPLGSLVIDWSGLRGVNARASAAGAAEICHLQVRPEYRSQGVATHLITAAEAMALRKGVPKVGIGVADDNERARRRYLRMGYVFTGAVDISEYEWIDAEGVAHAEVEQNVALVKDLDDGG